MNAEDGKNLLVPIAIYASKDEPVDEVRLPSQPRVVVLSKYFGYSLRRWWTSSALNPLLLRMPTVSIARCITDGPALGPTWRRRIISETLRMSMEGWLHSSRTQEPSSKVCQQQRLLARVCNPINSPTQCSIETHEVSIGIRHSHEQVVLPSPKTSVVSPHDAPVLASA